MSTMYTIDEKKAFAETLKLALATSIIRSKPKDVSAKQYAIQLAGKLKSAESSWKTKYTDLQRDHERAQQDIVLLKLRTSRSADDNSSQMMVLDECEEDQKDEKKAESKVIQKRDQFLQSVFSFNNWCGKLQLEDSSLKFVKTSFIQSMKDLESCFTAAAFGKHDFELMERNSQQLTEILKNKQFNSDVEIRGICSNIIRGMVMKLMNDSKTEDWKMKERICGCLLLLSGSCPSVRDVIMDTLVLVVIGFTKLLKDLTSFTRLNIAKYENVCYVCSMLKEIITSTCHEWPCRKLDEYSESLDRGLFEITGRFVMYSHTVWVLSSMMVDTNYASNI